MKNSVQTYLFILLVFVASIMLSSFANAAGIGVDKAMYRIDSNVWTTGNAGSTVEGIWVPYQYILKGLNANEPLPNFTITYPLYIGSKSSMYFDGLSNFRYCIDNATNNCAAQGGGTPGSIPDGTLRPISATTTGWTPFTPASINKGYGCTDPTNPTATGTIGVAAPCELHSFTVVPGIGGVPPNLGANSRITFFFELHLAQTPLWMNAFESQFEVGESHQIVPQATANPNNANYGYALYNLWTNAFGGSGIASTGSSQHVNIGDFQLNGNQGISQGTLTLPIPTVAASLASKISGQKFQDTNGNGIKDAGEQGIANWTIILTGSLTGDGPINFQTTTNSTGGYTFTQIYPGIYTLSEIIPSGSGYTETAPTNTPSGKLPNGASLPAGVTTTPSNYNIVIPNGTSVVLSNIDFGNKPPLGHLIVIKHVINDDNLASPATANDFTFTVAESGASPSTFHGSENGVDITVNPGTYHIAEDLNTFTQFYSTTASGDCTLTQDSGTGQYTATATVNAGETKTCTITNNDMQQITPPQPPQLTIYKEVVNSYGGTADSSSFTLHLALGTKQNSFPGASTADGGTLFTLVNGSTYVLSEDSMQGYSLVGITGDCAPDGSITLLDGDVKSCTITNHDVQPKLTVTKVVINHGSNKQFSDFPLSVDQTSVVSGVQNGFNSGTYTVSETNAAGYTATFTGNCDAQGSVTLDIGDVKTCTITNEEIQPKLTVTKVVVNDNGGTKVVSDFPLFVGQTSVVSGVQNGFNSGSYTVSETSNSGYNASAWSGDCAADGSITLQPGDVKACTITNDDKPGTLIVKKVVINDNGGTKQASDFSFSVNDGSSTPFNANGENDLTVNAGTYSVTEPAVTGYATTYSNCNNVQIANGGTATCTITNNDIAPKLTIIKQVVNEFGGTLGSADFTLHVTAINPSQTSFAGSNTGTQITLDAGNYSATEDTVTGYIQTSNDCVGTIAIGEEKTCTIVNHDVQPKLTVTKIVVNDNGGTKQVSDFPLFVDQTTVTSGVQNGFNAGSYTLTETSLSGYVASSWSGDCSSDGKITLKPGDVKSCTITNDDVAPKLTLVKTVINDNGGTKQVSDFPLFVNGNLVTSGVANTLSANVLYTATETSFSGYSASVWSGDCSSDGTITLQPGDNKTCTLTNNDVQPKLTVTKIVINHGSNKQVSDFPLSVDETTVVSGVQNGFDAGAHTISEVSDSSYTSTISGDCSVDGSITLQPGDVKSCTITNEEKLATITVNKIVINHGGSATESNFAPYNVDATQVVLGHVTTFDSGSHTVTEVASNDYTQTFSGNCNENGVVSLASGQNAVCTITNEEKPSKLIVTKVVVNDNGGTKVVSDFPLSVGQTSVVSGTENIFNSGTYTVSEISDLGYAASFSGDCNSDGQVTLIPGQTKTCTITNDDKPAHVIVIKHVVNDNGGAKTASDFTMNIAGTAGTATFSGVESPGVDTTVNAGTYDVTENSVNGYASSMSGDCSGIIANGETKTCTITNDDVAPKLTLVKVVVNDNGGTKVVSDFPLFVNGNLVTSGVANTLSANVLYTATETSLSGYAASVWGGDCASDGTITLQPGDDKTCTLTNNDIAPTIKVTKVVNNNHGGTAAPDDFKPSVGGNVVVSGSTTTVDANKDYAIDETSVSGYQFVSLTGDGCPETLGGKVNLAPGQNIECTITNEDIAPQLKVIKHVVNDNGGTATADQFTIGVIATNPSQASFAGSEDGTTITLDQGSYSVDETTQTSGYAKTLGTDCVGTLNVGETKTCTITNDDVQPKLTVTKIVINDNGGTKQVSDFPLSVDQTSVVSGVQNGFNAGTHTVSEISNIGYMASAWSGDCAADGSITLHPGDVKACTITNDDKPGTLIVKKVVINDNGGSGVASNFSFQVNSGTATRFNANGENDLTVNAGTYNVIEPVATGYATTYSNCNNVQITNGGTATCTITNDDIAPPVITRTQGFWQTHTDFTTKMFNTKLGSSMNIGSGIHRGTITTIGQLFGAYYSSIPKTSTGTSRNALDQARMTLLQQLVTAKLNCAAFNCTANIKTLISNADVAYATGTASQILSYSSQLDAYNNLGDGQATPVALGSTGTGTPKTSQTLANVLFWNTP